jgi:hypothetical protein
MEEHGVYIDVFEQMILSDHHLSKSCSFFASLSVELVVVSLAILIPLARTDHLPGFRWKSVSVGAPSKSHNEYGIRFHRAPGRNRS